MLFLRPSHSLRTHLQSCEPSQSLGEEQNGAGQLGRGLIKDVIHIIDLQAGDLKRKRKLDRCKVIVDSYLKLARIRTACSKQNIAPVKPLKFRLKMWRNKKEWQRFKNGCFFPGYFTPDEKASEKKKVLWIIYTECTQKNPFVYLSWSRACKKKFSFFQRRKGQKRGKKNEACKRPRCFYKGPAPSFASLGPFQNKARHGTVQTFFSSHETLRKFSAREQNINIHTNVLFSFVFLFLVAENVPLLPGPLSLVLFSISPNKNGGSYIVSQ